MAHSILQSYIGADRTERAWTIGLWIVQGWDFGENGKFDA